MKLPKYTEVSEPKIRSLIHLNDMISPSQQAKIMGLKNLKQVSNMTDTSLHTLINWHRDKPELFKIVLLGCLKRKPIEYGDWVIEYNPKPIQNSKWDFDYVHKDGGRGSAASLKECVDEIEDYESNF